MRLIIFYLLYIWTSKWGLFTAFPLKILVFKFFTFSSLLHGLNAKRGKIRQKVNKLYFDQQMWSAALMCLSKYTTTILLSV